MDPSTCPSHQESPATWDSYQGGILHHIVDIRCVLRIFLRIDINLHGFHGPLQVKHLNRQRHLPPPAPRRRSLPGRRVRQFRVRAWGGVLSLLKGPPRSQAGAQRPGRGDRMSRARRVLCRACLALAAVLAVLLLLPLPLPLPLPRAPAPDPDRVPTRSLTLEGDRLQPDDVFIAVKTTRKNHGPRLRLLLRTWISRAPRQVRVPSPAAQGPGFQAGAPGPRALHRLPDPLTAFSPTDVHFHRWRRP